MLDTFVHIKGVLNDVYRDSERPNTVSNKFVVRADTPETFRQSFNSAMDDIFRMQGMLVVKDEKKTNDLNNLKFIPMHMMARLEFETKPITGQYPQGGEGTKQ